MTYLGPRAHRDLSADSLAVELVWENSLWRQVWVLCGPSAAPEGPEGPEGPSGILGHRAGGWARRWVPSAPEL